MRYDGPEMQAEFKAAFGELDVRQAWALVKALKHVRLRCRNNAALYNWLNRNFTSLAFKEVEKQHLDGTKYPALLITSKVHPEDRWEPQSEEE